jgi:hypothetical protein
MSWINVGGNGLAAREQAVHVFLASSFCPMNARGLAGAIETAHRIRDIQGSSVRPTTAILGFDHWGA